MELELNKIYQGDALSVLKEFPSDSVDCVVTSPPYYRLRNYQVEGQIGLEKTYTEYINNLCDIFNEIKRVLKKTGTVWVNLGDIYSGPKNGNMEIYKNKKVSENNSFRKRKQNIPIKSLMQIPSRFAIEMTNRGWILRNKIIWHKPSCMPQSVTDRLTVDFEEILFFVKSKKYYFDQESIKEPTVTRDNIVRDRDNSRLNNTPGRTRMNGLKTNNYKKRNKRCVWTITTKPFKDAHFAVYPPDLIETPIKAGCPDGGVVLDPFIGSGTTALVARNLGKNYVGIELNKEYIKIIENRLGLKI